MRRILFCLSAEALMVLLGNDYISFDENGNIVLDFTDNPELVFQFDLNRYGHRQHHSLFLHR